MLTGLYVGKIFEDMSAKYLASLESLFLTSVYWLYLPTNSYQAMGSPFYVFHQTPCFIFLFIVCICCITLDNWAWEGLIYEPLPGIKHLKLRPNIVIDFKIFTFKIVLNFFRIIILHVCVLFCPFFISYQYWFFLSEYV